MVIPILLNFLFSALIEDARFDVHIPLEDPYTPMRPPGSGEFLNGKNMGQNAG